MKFDVTSDIHIDFWVDAKNGLAKQANQITQLIESSLLPNTPSNTLVIAGDIGHYNHQNVILFEILLKYYKNIIWVFGNHDLYQVSNKAAKKFNRNSFTRLDDMISLSDSIDNVHYLNGNIIELDGIKFGGSGSWYDNTYAHVVWGYGKNKTVQLWHDYMNDSNLITLPINSEFSDSNGRIDFCKFSIYEKNLLNEIAPECDVVISHVSPTWEHIGGRWNIPSSTFYSFDGRDMLQSMKETSVWVFGHTHSSYKYKSSYGPYMICNPLGYPEGDTIFSDLTKKAFYTVDLEELKTPYDQLFQ